ncbi:MAG: hypothetical protein QM734_07880 [Cyclobacteriaceae bacterium]
MEGTCLKDSAEINLIELIATAILFKQMNIIMDNYGGRQTMNGIKRENTPQRHIYYDSGTN